MSQDTEEITVYVSVNQNVFPRATVTIDGVAQDITGNDGGRFDNVATDGDARRVVGDIQPGTNIFEITATTPGGYVGSTTRITVTVIRTLTPSLLRMSLQAPR